MSKKRVFGRLTALGAFFVLLFAGGPAFAQEGPFPQLDGHRFSPTGTVPLPWVNSYIVSNLGMGTAYDAGFPPVIINGDTIPGLQGDLLFATLDLVDARLGTQLESLLSKGVNTITGFEVGWVARLLESRRDMLSLDVRVSNKNYTTVDIGRFVQDVVDGIDASIVRKNNAVRFAGGLRYARTFSNLFGIVANGELGVGESIERTEDDKAFYRLGAQADFDLAAWRNIPLNVALGLQTDSYPEATSDVDGNVNTGYLRLSYIARDDFTIGLEFSGSQVPTRDELEDLNYGGVMFDLRYYF